MILLTVVWVVVILSLLLLSQLRRYELRADGLGLAETDFRLRMAARSVLNQMLASMSLELLEGENLYDAPSDIWGWEPLQQRFGEAYRKEYPEILFGVCVEDEAGKLDLSRASLSSLSNLLENVGWTEMEADYLASAMKESTEQIQQALALTQSSQGVYEPIGLPALDLRYLLRIPRLSPYALYGEDVNFNGRLDVNERDGLKTSPPDDGNAELRIGLKSFLSLRSDGRVNPNFAPLEILHTIPGISSMIGEEIVRKRMGADRVLGTEDDFIFKKQEDLLSLSSVSRFQEFEYRKMIAYMRMTSQVFNIRINAGNEKMGQMHRIQTCVERKDDGEILVLAWQEDSGT